jgi:hypothetical protein
MKSTTATRKRSKASVAFDGVDGHRVEQVRHGVTVAVGPGGEEARKSRTMGRIELAHQAQVDDGDAVVFEDEDVARVQIRVHEAVHEDHLHQGAQAKAGDDLGIAWALARIQDLGALDVGHAQDAFRTVFLEDFRKDHVGLVAEVFAKAAVVPGFHAKIELGVDGAAKLLDRGFWRHRGQRRDLAQQVRHLAHDSQVEAADFENVRPPHLHRHDAAVV